MLDIDQGMHLSTRVLLEKALHTPLSDQSLVPYDNK